MSFELPLGDSVCHRRSGIKSLAKTGGNKGYGLKEASDAEERDAGTICVQHIIPPGISHSVNIISGRD